MGLFAERLSTKQFITSGRNAGVTVVFARTDPDAGARGISAFAVPTDTPGYDVTGIENKMGQRCSDTAQITFTDCRVPRNHLIGGKEEIPKAGSGGFKGAMKTFNMTRPGVAAFGLGMAEAALDVTRETLEETGVELVYGAGAAGQAAVAEKFSDEDFCAQLRAAESPEAAAELLNG